MSVTVKDNPDKETPVARVANQRLWLTADKSRAVADGDPAAASLLAAAAGNEIPADVDVNPKFLQGGAESKQAAKPADKAVRKSANKGG